MSAFELHLVPGYFTEAPARLLERLGLAPADGAPRDAMHVEPMELLDGLGRRMRGILTVRRVRLDRELVGLTIPKLNVANPADLELALLGLSCSALATESQGATLIGMDLGMPGGASIEGTVAEQVDAAIARLGERILVVVATADTARSLGEPPGFLRSELANLVEFRRTSAQ